MSFWSLPRLVELALFCAGGAAASGLPPVTARPRNAATSVASHQLVQRADAAERADQPDEAIALLRQAVAAEPANHDARVTLAGALLERHPDEALAILTELRDARCRACLRAVTDFVGGRHDSTKDETLRGKLEALARDAHGRSTRVSRAADAVWKAFERKEWRLLVPHVGETVRIKKVGTASDDPAEDRSAVALSPARLRAWFERQRGLDLHRDEAWYCTDRCCEYWSWNESRNDVTEYLERICFDTTVPRPILTRLEWESG
jgi:hypothetical protein